MATVLDNPQKIKQVDKSNMLKDLVKTPSYCKDAIERAKQVTVPEGVKPKNIVIIGMGGSAIGGEILQCWLRNKLPIPIQVCRDYSLPAYANKDTLVFANSYSGNTEETLTAFLSAIKRGSTVVAVTSGGQLAAFCKKLNLPHVIVPSGFQPRVAIPYMFFSLPVIMEKMKILSDIESELQETVAVLEKLVQANAPDMPTKDNKAKQLATELLGTIPVVYGFGQYVAVVHRMKAQFNENSKVHSKSDVFPELNHNETVGYESPDAVNKKHSVIVIRDPDVPPEIRARIETTTDLVFSRAKNLLTIQTKGEGVLAKMFSVLCVGDFASVYLALLQNKDPTPVDIIVRVKSELAKKSGMKEHFDAELAKLG